MKTNLGQLLKDLQTLDEASSLAPLNRPQHCAVQEATRRLHEALPELWGNQKPSAKKEDGK